MAGEGLNASFNECEESSGCGFTYRDDYELRKTIKISGEGHELNESELRVIIEDGNEKIRIPIVTGKKFERYIDVEKIYRENDMTFSNSRSVLYKVRFSTSNRRFHWIKLTELDFKTD